MECHGIGFLETRVHGLDCPYMDKLLLMVMWHELIWHTCSHTNKRFDEKFIVNLDNQGISLRKIHKGNIFTIPHGYLVVSKKHRLIIIIVNIFLNSQHLTSFSLSELGFEPIKTITNPIKNSYNIIESITNF